MTNLLAPELEPRPPIAKHLERSTTLQNTAHRPFPGCGGRAAFPACPRLAQALEELVRLVRVGVTGGGTINLGRGQHGVPRLVEECVKLLEG